MKFGKSKPEKKEEKPKGFTSEHKSKQQSMSDLLQLNRMLNENGELK